MTNSPELQAAAKAMYGMRPWIHRPYDDGPIKAKQWDELDESQKIEVCHIFAAGLAALLPVSDEIVQVMIDLPALDDPDSDALYGPSDQFVQAQCAADFTAAIKYIIGAKHD